MGLVMRPCVAVTPECRGRARELLSVHFQLLDRDGPRRRSQLELTCHRTSEAACSAAGPLALPFK